ncbi:MAG: hypothetical protein LC744_05875, partial [Chloroflexi bacterium]|nr:hypothetical protein [Chloroflexota bacterium]
MSLAPLDVILVRHAEPLEYGTPGQVDDDCPLTDAGHDGTRWRVMGGHGFAPVEEDAEGEAEEEET